MRSLSESDGHRRLVAVAVSVADVLDPGSDLRQVVGAAGETDVLVARVDEPGTARPVLPTDVPDYPDHTDDGVLPDGPVPAHDVLSEVPTGRTVPHLPASIHLHRLDLRWRVQEADEPDLVAALSELIGFDPEDQVFCVAPANGPDGVPDPELSAVERAVRRVARVYGLPVLHYRRAAAADVVVAPAV